MKWNVFSLEAVKEALKPKFVLEKVRYVTDDEEYGEGESTRLVFRNVEEMPEIDYIKRTVCTFIQDTYKTNKRCGCMYCPMSSYLNFAYLYKYYPENFRYMLEKMRETEELREKELGRPFSVISSNPKYNADYLEHIVKTKWLKKLNEMECTTKQKNIAAAKNQIEIGG